MRHRSRLDPARDMLGHSCHRKDLLEIGDLDQRLFRLDRIAEPRLARRHKAA